MKPYTSDQFDRATAIAAQCIGKASFTSWGEANTILRARQKNAKKATAHKQTRAERATLNIYRCRFCHDWHIGRGKG